MTPASHVLEIGCGSGLFTEKMAHTGAKTVAIDLSLIDLLELGRKKENTELFFEVADAHNLKYATNSFDIVVGSSILHHLEVDKAIDEVCRVLKPGGKMIFAEPNMLNPQIMIQKNVPFIKRLMGDSPDETAFFRWSLAALFAITRFLPASKSNHMIFCIRRCPSR